MNIAAKTTKPQNAVPQNFQTRGPDVRGGSAITGESGFRESIKRLSVGV
jgi:hypothetical protein